MNVIANERYKTITNEVKLYLKGRYGKAPGAVNENVRRQAIGNEEVIEVRPADLLPPELERLKNEIGDLAQNDEDVLTYAMFPDIGREFLQQRADNALVPESLEPHGSENKNVCMAATEFNVTMHGESYHIKVSGTGYSSQPKRPYYISIDGVPEEILVEALDSIVIGNTNHTAEPATAPTQTASRNRPHANAPGHVTTSMPGTIVDVLVKTGDQVNAGDPVLITEAMKMETEVQAPVTGTIKAVHVKKGDAVTPDEALVEIE